MGKVDRAIAYFMPLIDAKIVPIEQYFASFGPRVLSIIKEHEYRLQDSGATNLHNFRIPRGWNPSEFKLLKDIQHLMKHRLKGGRLNRHRAKQIYDVLESRSNPAFGLNCVRPKGIRGQQFDRELLYFFNAIGPAK